MPRARHLLFLVLLVTLTLGARSRPVTHPSQPVDAPPRDVFSVARPTEIRTTHLALDLDVDFDTRTIRGTATHTITHFTSATTFVLDVHDLDISGVTIDGANAEWQIEPGNAEGDALVVAVHPTTRTVRIDYETRPSSDALYWLTPLQTTGGVAPFLYTLTEPVYARSWIPVQDTPGVRATWEATVSVPPELLALMSAPNPTTTNPGGKYTFAMTTKVPAYLIGLAVGRLEFHPVGARTGFYAEPELAEAAAHDLQFLPEMFDAAEQIIAPYPWQRYDLLLAPPGFLVGGMEYPQLNFINSASVVSGNNDPVVPPSALLAHELAHTWAGDLMTCATWGDTWLNEGFATYLENRILEEMRGAERAEYAFFSDRRTYESYMRQVGEDDAATALHREFAAGDVPDVFTPAAYEKGGLFLKTLEDRLGRDAFDPFLRYYLERYDLHWVDDRAFLDALRTTALAGQPELEQEIGVDAWLYGTGLPSSVTAPTTSALWNRVVAEASAFRAGTPASSLNTNGWTSLELTLFLGMVSDLVPQRMQQLDTAFGMSQKRTASLNWWVPVALTRYTPAAASFDRFMMNGSWSVATVYDWLSRTPADRAYALSIYQRARPHYVPELQQRVDDILGYEASLRRAA
jgi:aminopeptidase N